MSETVRAIRLTSRPTLDTLRVGEVPPPTPRPGEVLLRVRATSLNYHDYLVVAGLIPQPAGRIPLSDGAGEVLAVGAGVSSLDVGDGVIGAFFPRWLEGPPSAALTADVSGETINGFAAEHVVVPANSLVRIPEGWSFSEAATLPCAGLTAWRALRFEGDLAAGMTVLLPGSGGLSVYALQLAKALGLIAITTSSSDAKLARLAELGADHGINYRSNPNWGEHVGALTGGVGADLVLEIGGSSSFAQSMIACRTDGGGLVVGSSSFAQSMIACRTDGRVMVVGSTSNAAPELPMRDLIMHQIRLQGMAVGSVTMLRDLVIFVEKHGIRPVIDRSFVLEELAAAFRYQLTGAHLGKIVMTL